MTPRSARWLTSELAVSFLLGTAAFATVHCASPKPAAEEGQAGNFAAEFANPTGTARPMFRWWWPGGLVDPAEIVREVHQIADAGFGGVEIADVWDSAVTVDPVEYGFGTEAWNTAVEAALRTAKERGLRVDLTIGPHWPSVVPSQNPDGPELAKEIVHGQVVVEAGSTYSGAVPEPVLAPKPYITEKTLLAVQAFRCPDGCGAKPAVLDETTLIDLTGSVGDGALDWTAPDAGEWALIAFWMRGNGQRSAMYGPNPDNSAFTDPDAYVVDHYGKAGTDAVIAYWENTLLAPSIRALLAEVGGAIFEDSLELQSNGRWTPGLLEEFENRRGYSLKPYLALTVGTVAAGFPPLREDAFAFGGGLAERVRHDHEQTLSDLWLERRIAPFTEWARSLGMEYRNQGYGEPVDSILSAATTDIPEGESLGFGDNAMDAFRALAAGRDLGGGRLLSDEVGAYFGGAYATTWHQMLSTMGANYAAGVNQMVLHGFAYADAPDASRVSSRSRRSAGCGASPPVRGSQRVGVPGSPPGSTSGTSPGSWPGPSAHCRRAGPWWTSRSTARSSTWAAAVPTSPTRGWRGRATPTAS
jgi:hypothetical protein